MQQERGRKKSMKQYCRYCQHMCCGDANYCSVKNKVLSDNTIRSLNRCKHFDFNPIDAMSCDVDKQYKPKNKTELSCEQLKWSD